MGGEGEGISQGQRERIKITFCVLTLFPIVPNLLFQSLLQVMDLGGEVSHGVLVHGEHAVLVGEVLLHCTQLILKCLQELRRERGRGGREREGGEGEGEREGGRKGGREGEKGEREEGREEGRGGNNSVKLTPLIRTYRNEDTSINRTPFAIPNTTFV